MKASILNTLNNQGYAVVEEVYSASEIDEILESLKRQNLANEFGVREFLIQNPEIREKVFTKKLLNIIQCISPTCNKAIKSIYFDKPPNANWIVNWHQDLTINLCKKQEIPLYKNWRQTNGRVVVQPDLEMLQSIFTIRIHLDKCTEDNGALRVIERSHKQGVVDIKKWMQDKNGQEKVCNVGKGGILLMKPLTLHSSRRTENQQNRRVIHIEFTDKVLPVGLEWKEKLEII